ncbi:MAG: squalene--hopene cyclase [Candidatus Omnitrophica bacterium]|nr:squalene--hopene cyclase [Candidatus Omnitrophota bacterium]
MLANPTAVLFDAPRTVSDEIRKAIEGAGRYLLSRQSPQGYWVGELEADTTLESDSIKLWRWLGRVDREREERLVRAILRQQLPDGGWPIYAGGPAELNATVKAYVALKLAGHSPLDPVLKRAGQRILQLGGLERVNSFEKVYLALFGCYPWDQVPALPPELVLFPRWFPFNLYEISYWSRTILVPLAVVYATRPTASAAGLNLEELWVNPDRKRARITNLKPGGLFWRGFFLVANRLLKLHESSPVKPWRARALREADRWITDRLIETDGLGAIFPAMVNAVFALRGLGYQDGDPLFEQQVREMERLELSDGDCLKVQPCFAPVWDTAIALYVLARSSRAAGGPSGAASASGSHPDSDAVQKGMEWLLAQEIRRWGDWAVKNPRGRPGGWAFEFRNPVYPDVDDTAQVLLALQAVSTLTGSDPAGSDPRRIAGPFRRGLDWVLSMQNRDGGWSSFDKNNDCRPLTHFPFADHNAMLDPSAADITGRILELLAAAGIPRGHPSVRRAVAFLERSQEVDGTWFGRWGVNHIYGSWLALRGLKAVGEPMESGRYQRAGEWLVKRQNPDGGWGESCGSYDDPSTKGKGPSTPSQTAWALMTLISLDRAAEPAFQRGLRFLLQSQQADGNWAEEWFTGTGFPRVFYLKYHLYRSYFPLLALIEAQPALKRSG